MPTKLKQRVHHITYFQTCPVTTDKDFRLPAKTFGFGKFTLVLGSQMLTKNTNKQNQTKITQDF